DVVLAVGNPLNLGQTVTMGIISAKGRSTGVGDGSYEDFLQTDAPINHGNSGGALVNTKGELIGINSQILSPSDGNIGIGFAIPANMARRVMSELRTEGHVRRAQLGVQVQPVTAEMAESLGVQASGGVIVSSVGADGAAADDKAVLGIAVVPLTPDRAARSGLRRDLHGVLVQQVSPEGRAADAGVQEGDVILEVNRLPVQSVEDLRDAVRRAPPAKP